MMTSLDITKTYDLTSLPEFGTVPYFTTDFSKYGITDLSAGSLLESLGNLAAA
jgi:hypothetical protein